MNHSPNSISSLDILARQALPKLWAKYFPEERFLVNGFHPTTKAAILGKLFARGASWWDIFDASDIGAERSLIANRFVSKEAEVLDVGCGRGFFTYACAKRTSRIAALDLMDGRVRIGWWKDFVATSKSLEISGRVFGVRGSASSIPFGEATFDLVAAVHSIRNFGTQQEIRSFFQEAKRALKRGGRLVLVESETDNPGFPAYRAFYSLRTKLGWELKLPSIQEMVRWIERDGFEKVSQESFEIDLEYAPVYFLFNHTSMKGLKRDYDAANNLLLEGGERHPPVSIISAVR